MDCGCPVVASSRTSIPEAVGEGGRLVDPDDKEGPPTGAANRALATEGEYEYEAIAETGHLLQIERPEACRQAMLSFLRKLALA